MARQLSCRRQSVHRRCCHRRRSILGYISSSHRSHGRRFRSRCSGGNGSDDDDNNNNDDDDDNDNGGGRGGIRGGII